MLDYFAARGVDKVSYHAAATAKHSASIVSQGFTENWVCHYISDNLLKVDPRPALAATLSHPFFWSQAHLFDGLTVDNMSFLEELEMSGVGDGLALYVFGPKMRNAYVGLGFADEGAQPNAADVAEFHAVAQMAHLKYCAIVARHEERVPRLSRREQETLEWAARGKSNAAIAQILGISKHTVDTLMRRIYEKLGVADRTSAAIKAIGSGLLQNPNAMLT